MMAFLFVARTLYSLQCSNTFQSTFFCAGVVCTYVNGRLCHMSSQLDPMDLRLQYKLVVLGGGRQAQNRGGDLRRITIHSKEFNAEEMMGLYYHLAADHPGVGGRAVRIQAAFRGFIKVRSVPLAK